MSKIALAFILLPQQYSLVIDGSRFGTIDADALIPNPISSQKIPTDESTSNRQECFVDISALFEAHSQPTKLIQPSEGSLYHLAPAAQSSAMCGVPLCEPRFDPAIS